MPLYIVSTPIGNMEDISFRAIKTLKDSDYILCEDTRRTKKILVKYNINKKLVSFNENNERRKTPYVIEDCRTKNVSLLTDNGTPTISDPGFYLIRECHKVNIDTENIDVDNIGIENHKANNVTTGNNAAKVKIIPVPGPAAFVTALSASGLPTDKFTFIGFLSKNKRKRELEKYMKGDYGTIIIYESPYRIHSTLQDILDIDDEAVVCVARELTKRYEEIITMKIKDIMRKKIKEKGEFTIIISTNRKVFK